MATVAITGYGGTLASGPVNLSAFTTVAQLKKFDFSGIKAEFEDITNLSSPNIAGLVFKEWLKVLADGGNVTFDGVFNPEDATTQALFANLASSPANSLVAWKITLSNGTTTYIFLGYVEEFKFGNEYNKCVPFSGSVKMVGPPTVAY